MENFKGNSDASKELPRKKIQPVTTNVVVKQSSSDTTKPGRKFFAEDAKTVGGHVVETIIIPSAQRLLSDVVKGAIDWLIYGSKGAAPRSGPGTISYGSYFNRSGLVNPSPIGYSQPQILPQQTPTLYRVNDIVINDRGAVEEVLIRLREMINSYGMVSVGDFYDLVGVRANFTDYKWGWFDLSKVDVIRVDDGFCIRFPKIQPIEK